MRRFSKDRKNVADAVFDVRLEGTSEFTIIDPADMTRKKIIPPGLEHEDLLVPVFANGQCVYKSPDIGQMRAHTLESLSRFDQSLKRFINPHAYPVGFERSLYEHKIYLILQARNQNDRAHHR